MLYETILSKLGSRMSLNFRPQEKRVYYSPLGRYYDAPLDLRIGVQVGEEIRCLPFTDQHSAFPEIEQHLTMTGVLYRATWREVGLRLEAEFISPFYPQDEQVSTAPLFYLRVSLQRFGQVPPEHPVEQAEVLVEMDWAADQAGVTSLQTTATGDTLHRIMQVDLSQTEIGKDSFFIPDMGEIGLTLAAEDLLQGEGPSLTVSEQGFRFLMVPDGEEARVTWVGFTSDPIMRVHGDLTPFKYTEFFGSGAEVLAWATAEREAILAKTRFFDGLFTRASFTAAERDLHAFGFQSYLAMTWWTRRPDGRDWYSVWEGCCLFHSTVDVEYNMATFYLLFWPKLLELELDAWADFALARPDVAGKFLSHDIGIRHEVDRQAYPHPMEIEENANYLLLLYGFWRTTGEEGCVQRNWALAREFSRFLMDADKNGNGFPQVGVANTIDDASPAVQFSHEQTYLAVKTAAALHVVGIIARHLGDAEFACACETRVALIDRTLQEQAWLGDHYAVCIDQGVTEIADPWHPGLLLTDVLEEGGRIRGWDAYSLYTSLGLLTLQMTDTVLPLSYPERLRQDIVRAAQESQGPYGCFHSSSDHSNEWISMNLHRDFVAAYMGVDLITPHTGLYWNFELHNNSAAGRGGCFTDTYGGNFLHYYPRGLTSMGMLTALGGVQLDRVAGTLKVNPVRLPLRLPLVQLADWEALRVPWVSATCGEEGLEVEISDPHLLAGTDWEG
ncbi:MAG TPA: DUF4965 domain-containing protein [Armatimonadota bacterium]|jgi:hypothetical protein